MAVCHIGTEFASKWWGNKLRRNELEKKSCDDDEKGELCDEAFNLPSIATLLIHSIDEWDANEIYRR